MTDVIDQQGYRANVGIVLINNKKEIFFAKRKHQSGWQFPQGGIGIGESLKSAMYRELLEETGLTKDHVEVIYQSKTWYQYKIPKTYLRKLTNGSYQVIGQKQKWFLVKLNGSDVSVNLTFDSKTNQEFDDWKWVDVSIPAKEVIWFKQNVYQKVLTEFQTFL
jgi:putative (di)nucleoside polyphosphate hydrolase